MENRGPVKNGTELWAEVCCQRAGKWVTLRVASLEQCDVEPLRFEETQTLTERNKYFVLLCHLRSFTAWSPACCSSFLLLLRGWWAGNVFLLSERWDAYSYWWCVGLLWRFAKLSRGSNKYKQSYFYINARAKECYQKFIIHPAAKLGVQGHQTHITSHF